MFGQSRGGEGLRSERYKGVQGCVSDENLCCCTSCIRTMQRKLRCVSCSLGAQRAQRGGGALQVWDLVLIIQRNVDPISHLGFLVIFVVLWNTPCCISQNIILL